jgi:hypothetical protein
MRCRGVQGLANLPFLGRFLCSALLSVAPYCVPGGIRVVSENLGLGAAAFADQIRRVRLRRSMSLVSSALPGAAPALTPGTTWFPHAATLSGHSRLSSSARVPGSSTKNTLASIGKQTRTAALGYRSAAIPTARHMLCAWTDTSKREGPSRIRIETLTIAYHSLSSPVYCSHLAAI